MDIMEERSAFDILFDKLSARGLQPKKIKSERSFVVPGKDRLSNIKFIVAKNKSLFFCAYDSYGTSAFSSKTFTGIYSIIDLSAKTDCYIYKKDWLDRFLRKNKRKTGLNFIDENLTITSSTKWSPSLLLSLNDVKLFLEINESIAPLKVTIQHDYLSIIEELEDKTIIGIETDQWIYEDSGLDLIIKKGGQLIENMTNACS